ncbi:MAG: site-2 protease family protein [Elusimicrobia bacterium]|nr:site-2 protease family protein [Elusimicrobiota bacterium]
MEWVLQLPVLFFSVVVHEFCHGVAAYERGDDTAERAGRLTLNPLPHIDAFGTIFLPLLCLFSSVPVFAWAKPVPVDPSRMRDPKGDAVKVAAVGPLSNILLALASAVMYKLVHSTAFFAPEVRGSALDLLLFGVTINLFLAFFNLLPIHPLDGSKVLAGLLPARARAAYLRHVPYGMIILMVLLFTHGINAFVVLPLKLVLALWVKLGIIG